MPRATADRAARGITEGQVHLGTLRTCLVVLRDKTQHCILPIGVHIARYMKLLHRARNMHLLGADCAQYAWFCQFCRLRATCTSYAKLRSFIFIACDVHELRICHSAQYADCVKMGVLCAMCCPTCTLYTYLSSPPRSCCTRLGLLWSIVETIKRTNANFEFMNIWRAICTLAGVLELNP